MATSVGRQKRVDDGQWAKWLFVGQVFGVEGIGSGTVGLALPGGILNGPHPRLLDDRFVQRNGEIAHDLLLACETRERV